MLHNGMAHPLAHPLLKPMVPNVLSLRVVFLFKCHLCGGPSLANGRQLNNTHFNERH